MKKISLYALLVILFLPVLGCIPNRVSQKDDAYPESAIRPESEPYWAEFVRNSYPGWSRHYWTDRNLWGNRGYIFGKPPEMPSEKNAALHLRGVDKQIKQLDLSEIFVQESAGTGNENLESFDTLPMKPKATKHVVVKGESLWVIAGYEETYGNPLMWPLIYQSNRDKIKDPDWIYPGQVFIIPPKP
ncbi:MAG: LysM peptidoglycan-binding domain-containing protein [Chlamydiota bacterium]|nr:LysM peptidoglycan-binding domain-containing protein [Chlamydiota bacterium]